MAALSGAVAWTSRQIWKVVAHAAASSDSSGVQNRSCFFPENDRQHTHGKGSVRHVQELNSNCMTTHINLRVISCNKCG